MDAGFNIQKITGLLFPAISKIRNYYIRNFLADSTE